jgi:hydroxyacylglutathione hydrolase
MNVIPIEALSDNYMYLIVDEATKECAAVDPVEPKKILEKVKELGLNLTKILTTHHHWDHANGNPELVESLNVKIPVYGGDERIPGLTDKIGHNDQLNIGSLKVTCLFTPCHTTGHICYFVSKNEANLQPAVFTGDTLFISGCGRFFEGNAEQMFNNLINILAKLPSNTLLYCGHEYSIQNLKFSLHVEPTNETTKAKLNWAEQMRSSNLRTIPSTIKDELEFNPFMRVQLDHFKKRYNQTDAILVMQELRKEKDNWKA